MVIKDVGVWNIVIYLILTIFYSSTYSAVQIVCKFTDNSFDRGNAKNDKKTLLQIIKG